MKVDSIVLGAGVIGMSIALHLQKRGQSVAVVDRGGAGRATSFGNAGLIQREAVYPYAFPRGLAALFRYALNRRTDAYYHPQALPGLTPFLMRFWRNSHPVRHTAVAKQYATLMTHSLSETESLVAEAGARSLLKLDGWVKVFRSAAARDGSYAEAERWQREFGIPWRPLDREALRVTEPHLRDVAIGGLHYTDAGSVSDPGGLVDAYRMRFEELGGTMCTGDAFGLERRGRKWAVDTEAGTVEAESAVVALGPWADRLSAKFGYHLSLAVKRGYHMHYAPQAGAKLNHPILDVERGYMLAPMNRGIRLTTGIEFARGSAKQTPVQLGRAEPDAHSLFPLTDRLEAVPWMGSRPCTPDMLPVLGPAPKHPGLWFAFGHAHHGLTLGAVSGRLIAEMITGAEPVADPCPFRVDRPSLQLRAA